MPDDPWQCRRTNYFLRRLLDDGYYWRIFSENLMNSTTIVLLASYTCAIFSLIWARLTFFKIKSSNTRLSAVLYDPVAALHIGATYYHLLASNTSFGIWATLLACMFYIIGILLFWWGINTSKNLNYAFGSYSGTIITSGPFRYIRHPFYTSYMLIWLPGTLLFNSPLLWITLFYLVAFYLSSAKSEEREILSSESAMEYSAYCKATSMFIPRIKSWKN